MQNPVTRTPAASAPLNARPEAGHGLVSRIEDLSPEWLTAVLHARGRLGAAARVTGVRTQPVGNGMMAATLRLELRYDRDEPGAPRSLVAKLPSIHEASLQFSVSMGVYIKEVRFYQEIAPMLPVGVSHPLFADIDASGARFCILFEDLAPARMGDQIQGCDARDAGVAMDTAAEIHAPFWGDPSIDALPWMGRDRTVGLYRDTYIQTHAQVCAHFSGKLEPAVLGLIEQFASRITDYYARQPRPWTITHQDYRLDNLLFEARGGAMPLAVLDWQTIRIGPGMSDVSYFIGAGLDADLCREHEQALVRRYLAALGRLGIAYDFDAAWEAYRVFAAEGLITAVIAAAMVTPTERGDRMFVAMFSRHGRHMLDHDTLSLIR